MSSWEPQATRLYRVAPASSQHSRAPALPVCTRWELRSQHSRAPALPVALPLECIEIIVQQLPPRERFRCATQLRLVFVQRRCLLLVTSQVRASAQGDLVLLRTLKDSQCLDMENATRAMVAASQQGHVHILTWWKQIGAFETEQFKRWVGTLGAYMFIYWHGGCVQRIDFLDCYLWEFQRPKNSTRGIRWNTLYWWIDASPAVADIIFVNTKTCIIELVATAFFAPVFLILFMYVLVTSGSFAPSLIRQPGEAGLPSSETATNIRDAPVLTMIEYIFGHQPRSVGQTVYQGIHFFFFPWRLSLSYLFWRMMRVWSRHSHDAENEN